MCAFKWIMDDSVRAASRERAFRDNSTDLRTDKMNMSNIKKISHKTGKWQINRWCHHKSQKVNNRLCSQLLNDVPWKFVIARENKLPRALCAWHWREPLNSIIKSLLSLQATAKSVNRFSITESLFWCLCAYATIARSRAFFLATWFSNRDFNFWWRIAQRNNWATNECTAKT